MHSKAKTYIIAGLVVGILVLFAGVARFGRNQSEFSAWYKNQHEPVDRYAAFLQTNNVGKVLPLEQLLTSARERAQCPSLRYEIPPPEVWNNIVSTLQLLKILRDRELIKPRAATSGYRSPTSNDCSRGAKSSIHLRNNAIDLNIDSAPEHVKRLCDFWRTHGSAHRFGLGFYDSTSIHIDTSGYRTWGYDYTTKTSMCLSKQQ